MSKGKYVLSQRFPGEKNNIQKPILASSATARNPARETKIPEFGNKLNLPTFLV